MWPVMSRLGQKTWLHHNFVNKGHIIYKLFGGWGGWGQGDLEAILMFFH